LQREFAFEPARQANQVGSGASVKTEAADYFDGAFSHV
jgi:hypothetical protein